MTPTDVTRLTAGELADLLAAAVRLGARDATAGENRRPTGAEIIEALGYRAWRGGHARAVRSAYMAGRFHVETMGRALIDVFDGEARK